MLAALLLNLPDQRRQDGDGGKARQDVAYRSNRRQVALQAAEKLEEYIGGTKKLEAVKKAAKRVKSYIEQPETSADQVFELSRQIQMREFELRQELAKRDAQSAIDYLFVLEQFSVFVQLLQDDEEEILVLLME